MSISKSNIGIETYISIERMHATAWYSIDFSPAYNVILVQIELSEHKHADKLYCDYKIVSNVLSIDAKSFVFS